ncbi:hypothetical protein [Paenibacillus spongiae]|uniref:Uncharacterized protein n=1 Tax=Paenibacillus spongiae TaxID=2909671 RepID=A0ABY5SKE0_9BACL|nr:hypothetical protein [Paenibacillus spongiae]UVI33063.1 hypothetical protein L1F29_15015 [Paenibacillus spongiae]
MEQARTSVIQLDRTAPIIQVSSDAAAMLLRDAVAIRDALTALVNQYTLYQFKQASLSRDLLRDIQKGNLNSFARTVNKQSGKKITAAAAKSLLAGLEHLL